MHTECVICFTAARDCVLVPCGHAHTCMQCSEALTSCPFCREAVERVIRLYTDANGPSPPHSSNATTEDAAAADRPRTPETRSEAEEAEGEEEEEEEAPPEGNALVGRRICVWWEGDRKWYAGLADAYDAAADPPMHHVLYDDGDERTYQMSTVRWRLEEQPAKRRHADTGPAATTPAAATVATAAITAAAAAAAIAAAATAAAEAEAAATKISATLAPAATAALAQPHARHEARDPHWWLPAPLRRTLQQWEGQGLKVGGAAPSLPPPRRPHRAALCASCGEPIGDADSDEVCESCAGLEREARRAQAPSLPVWCSGASAAPCCAPVAWPHVPSTTSATADEPTGAIGVLWQGTVLTYSNSQAAFRSLGAFSSSDLAAAAIELPFELRLRFCARASVPAGLKPLVLLAAPATRAKHVSRLGDFLAKEAKAAYVRTAGGHDLFVVGVLAPSAVAPWRLDCRYSKPIMSRRQRT